MSAGSSVCVCERERERERRRRRCGGVECWRVCVKQQGVSCRGVEWGGGWKLTGPLSGSGWLGVGWRVWRRSHVESTAHRAGEQLAPCAATRRSALRPPGTEQQQRRAGARPAGGADVHGAELAVRVRAGSGRVRVHGVEAQCGYGAERGPVLERAGRGREPQGTGRGFAASPRPPQTAPPPSALGDQ